MSLAKNRSTKRPRTRTLYIDPRRDETVSWGDEITDPSYLAERARILAPQEVGVLALAIGFELEVGRLRVRELVVDDRVGT